MRLPQRIKVEAKDGTESCEFSFATLVTAGKHHILTCAIQLLVFVYLTSMVLHLFWVRCMACSKTDINIALAVPEDPVTAARRVIPFFPNIKFLTLCLVPHSIIITHNPASPIIVRGLKVGNMAPHTMTRACG